MNITLNPVNEQAVKDFLALTESVKDTKEKIVVATNDLDKIENPNLKEAAVDALKVANEAATEAKAKLDEFVSRNKILGTLTVPGHGDNSYTFGAYPFTGDMSKLPDESGVFIVGALGNDNTFNPLLVHGCLSLSVFPLAPQDRDCLTSKNANCIGFRSIPNDPPSTKNDLVLELALTYRPPCNDWN